MLDLKMVFPVAKLHCMEQLHEQPKSAFAKKLAANPELARRCEQVVQRLREAAADDLQAIERSLQLTAEDFAATIVPCPLWE